MFAWLGHILGFRRSTIAPSEAHGDATSAEEVYLDAAVRFLNVQIDTSDLLDTKAWQSVSVGSVALPLTLAFLNLSNAAIPRSAESVLVLALVFYLALLACAARASLVRGLEYRPNITTLREHSETYPGGSLKRWVANEYEASCRTNAGVLVRKARWVGAATVAFYLETLCLSAAIATLLL